MKIKSFTTKTGEKIKLNKISLLVGANNVGKSQTLKDIQQRMETGVASKPVLLKEIDFEKPANFDDLFDGLTLKDSERNIGFKIVEGIKNNLSQSEKYEFQYEGFKKQFEQDENFDFILGNISKFRVSHLDASSRLNLVKTTPSFNPDYENPINIIQNLFIASDNEKLLQKAFLEAFSMNIILDYNGLKEFCLRVAKSFPKIPDNPREGYKITKDFSKIDDQGDGFRSFVGIILSILFSKQRIILLDEPEAFLHPAQARYLGKWIADNSNLLNGQLIISTHNANFLSGILSSSKEIDIYRLNRLEDITTYNLIPPSATQKLAKSPMLSSQRILESIFHKGVVVCEADADRTVYQTVSNLVHNNQEILFVHSHNKQTLKDVASLLIDAKIPVATVADIDILNGESDFKRLVETMTQKPIEENISTKRKKISQEINKVSDKEVLDNLKTNLEEFLRQLNKDEHSFDGARGAVNRIRSEMNKWNSPKTQGIAGFPGNVQDDVKWLIEKLKEYRIFIVPVGELEGWLDVEIKRKNKWIIEALEKIHSNEAGKPLEQFVQELLRSVN